ncbi:ABC transporter permease [Nonlabens sp. SY33080]|uniref:ABC transporter permease n=1 Tax=Nonlabens sp. SY33080 TaxID=2719911 RepID=UPI001428973D|nr:ABC transporter permease [Nonlabens sp. SY33080]
MTKELETKVYQRGNRLHLSQLVKEVIKDLATSRFLAFQLAKRDISSSYRQSFLGIIWAFITPISTALVWIFINSSGTVDLKDTGVPYPVFVFTGTLLWSILTESINMPLSATNGAKGLLSKINFPKEALILSGIYKILFNSIFKFLLLIFFFLYFQIIPGWNLVFFPFTFLFLMIFGVCLGLWITPLGMLYNDVGKAIAMGLRFVMYVTPVVYTIPDSGIMKTIMEYNPLTPVLVLNRTIILNQELLFVDYFLWLVVITLPILLLALVIYRISIPVIVERLSA